MTKRHYETNHQEGLSQDEMEGLAIIQEQILDAYNAGTSDEPDLFGKTKGVNDVPSEHTDEDS
ncbi:DUF4025 domain-containing protein [Alicyclobacillus sp. SO9]|uniref:DUF4025 domain-containing protein n=1 Tax=Alicyclobacillus sp. SO9 TaxID=2665646 RepID=UPI0018E8E091|nr:DUF4025 domain-containing protein [Alicyclobacillus sp. SO9]QQE77640.1 DUF4025 domain-containing protein [Alicyclobacillus sp. SO9]